jgi:hypothetical protein
MGNKQAKEHLMVKIRTILHPTDFSEHSEAALGEDGPWPDAAIGVLAWRRRRTDVRPRLCPSTERGGTFHWLLDRRLQGILGALQEEPTPALAPRVRLAPGVAPKPSPPLPGERG